MFGVILYGPPGSGKSTITKLLQQTLRGGTKIRLIKVANGTNDEYLHMSRAEFNKIEPFNILWSTERYGTTYAIRKDSIVHLESSLTPIIELGQAKAIKAVEAATDYKWFKVSLQCTKETAARRLTSRKRQEERIDNWHNTEPIDADVTLDTTHLSVAETKQLIVNEVEVWSLKSDDCR